MGGDFGCSRAEHASDSDAKGTGIRVSRPLTLPQGSTRPAHPANVGVMNAAGKITTGLAALTVVGLAVLAVPAIAPLFAATESAATTKASAPASTPTDAPTVGVVDVGPGGVDYQDIGGGVSIPATGPGECSTWSAIHPYGAWDPQAKLGGTMTDLGPVTYASGSVGLNSEGEIETYTVAAGDTGMGIGERLCIDYVTVLAYNDTFMSDVGLQPGDVLVLRP